MGRKSGSYKFEKRQKELRKQKKKQEKLERRQNKGGEFDDEPQPNWGTEALPGGDPEADTENETEENPKEDVSVSPSQ
ncbi:MAG: hypothetical protein ACC742_14030 [Thermoanaerobaculales bacterium]